MPRYKLILEYDGTGFHGWQSQKNAASIQDALEAALKVLFRETLRVDGASRTDAGVHAHGQVAAFNSDREMPTEKVRFGLNGILPRSIQVRACETVPDVFDPRRDPLSKTYRYTWVDGTTLAPFWRDWAWYSHHRLDEGAMQRAADAIVGEHDFSAFRAAGCTAKSPVRRILKVQVRRKDDRVTFEIQGQAFLQQMVRILAGTLYEVGIGKFAPERMAQVLASKDRLQAGKTAVAKGLMLWGLEYGAIPRPGRKIFDSRKRNVPNEA